MERSLCSPSLYNPFTPGDNRNMQLRNLTHALLLAGSAFGTAAADESFDTLAIHLEQNATDGDAEVVIKATSNADGLSALEVVAPDGRALLNFESPDSKLGIRSFSLESPEPSNDGRVQADFPTGAYRVSGTAVSGSKLAGESTLSHALPATVTITKPADGQEGVPVNGLVTTWSAVPGIKQLILVLEDEDTEMEMAVDLPGDATTFNVPDGWMRPGVEYKLAVGSVAADGNRSFVEIGFETAGAD
jgi:hypothetical protein